MPKLKEVLNEVPIMALTATLTPQNEKTLVTDVLRNPCIIKSSINPVNIKMNLKLYSGNRKVKKDKNENSGKFTHANFPIVHPGLNLK